MAEPTPVSSQEFHLPWALRWQGLRPQGRHQLRLFTAIITAGVPPGRGPGTKALQSQLLSLLMHLGLPPPPPPPLGRAIKEGLGRIRNRCRSTPNLCHPAYLCIWQALLVSPEPRAGQQNPCASQQPELGTASQGAVPSLHRDLTLMKAGVRRLHLFLRSGSAPSFPAGAGAGGALQCQDNNETSDGGSRHSCAGRRAQSRLCNSFVNPRRD